MLPLAAREYIVNEIVRRYGDLPPRFVQNVRRNVRRNFKTGVSAEEVERFIPFYKSMYRDAAAMLRDARSGSLTPPLEDGDRLVEELTIALASRYHDQPTSILRIVAGSAVYYEVYR